VTWDLHVHSHHSWDGDPTATLANLALRCAEEGLTGIALTDHVDSTPIGLNARRPARPWDYALLITELSDRPGLDVKAPVLLTGVEYGEPHLNKDEFLSFIGRWNPTVVNASVHAVPENGALVAIDTLASHYPGDDLMRRSLRESLALLEAQLPITALSHVDYPLRFTQAGSYDANEYRDLLEGVLNAASDSDVALEVNTRRGTGFYEWFVELDPQLSTTLSLASDAHTPAALANGVKRAEARFLHLGYKTCRYRPHMLCRNHQCHTTLAGDSHRRRSGQ